MIKAEKIQKIQEILELKNPKENHFSNGSFERRFAEGQVLPVLVRMKDVLIAGV